jgi:hypothetical protein
MQARHFEQAGGQAWMAEDALLVGSADSERLRWRPPGWPT